MCAEVASDSFISGMFVCIAIQVAGLLLVWISRSK
jgi:hypothetical protein